MCFGDFSKNISKPLDRKILYSELLISDKLNSYLADINEQAEEMFSRLVYCYECGYEGEAGRL